jgi:SAM-dependent methyltransferase
MSAPTRSLLRCPDCRGELTFAPDGESAACPACGFAGGPVDFLPRSRGVRNLALPLECRLEECLPGVPVGPPPVNYFGPRPPRGSIDLMSVLNAERRDGRPRLLDLGCGGGEYQTVIRSLGFDWVGVDVCHQGPTIRADAHALPFRDGAFDVAFSVAVIEHVHNPFVAVAEVFRVLKPGSLFLGVAAFGEPFHASFFHASPWGLASLLLSRGFAVERLWQCRDTLTALADMGGYPRVVRWLLAVVSAVARLPALSPRRWLRGGPAGVDALTTAGSLGFCARKPAPAGPANP